MRLSSTGCGWGYGYSTEELIFIPNTLWTRYVKTPSSTGLLGGMYVRDLGVQLKNTYVRRHIVFCREAHNLLEYGFGVRSSYLYPIPLDPMCKDVLLHGTLGGYVCTRFERPVVKYVAISCVAARLITCFNAVSIKGARIYTR